MHVIVVEAARTLLVPRYSARERTLRNINGEDQAKGRAKQRDVVGGTDVGRNIPRADLSTPHLHASRAAC